MSIMDTQTKQYISRPNIFADAFNYLLYNGRQVIQPEALLPVDTTEIAMPYGNGAKVPIQKYRDNMKIWAAMHDGKAVYVLLGSENQTKVHYAMPVKNMLYDSINYAGQVEQARKSYKNFKYDDDGVRIKLTAEEFLSGFRKGDKLIPVITAVILFDPDNWNAPLSIHEMLDVDEELLPFIPDYRINLIAPSKISDSDFSSRDVTGKFHTGFGTLMQVIKHQNEVGVADILRNAPKVDVASADMIAEVANVKFEKTIDKKGEMDMCKGMEEYTRKTEIIGAIKIMKLKGETDDSIVKTIVDFYKVTEEYVKSLMESKPA